MIGKIYFDYILKDILSASSNHNLVWWMAQRLFIGIFPAVGNWGFAYPTLVFSKELFREFDNSIFINLNINSYFLITSTSYELEGERGKLLELSNKKGTKSYVQVKHVSLFSTKEYDYYQEKPLSAIWCENRKTGLVEGLILPCKVNSDK